MILISIATDKTVAVNPAHVICVEWEPDGTVKFNMIEGHVIRLSQVLGKDWIKMQKLLSRM